MNQFVHHRLPCYKSYSTKDQTNQCTHEAYQVSHSSDAKCAVGAHTSQPAQVRGHDELAAGQLVTGSGQYRLQIRVLTVTLQQMINHSSTSTNTASKYMYMYDTRAHRM